MLCCSFTMLDDAGIRGPRSVLRVSAMDVGAARVTTVLRLEEPGRHPSRCRRSTLTQLTGAVISQGVSPIDVTASSTPAAELYPARRRLQWRSAGRRRSESEPRRAGCQAT